MYLKKVRNAKEENLLLGIRIKFLNQKQYRMNLNLMKTMEPNGNEDFNVPEKGKKCKRRRPSRNKNLIPQSKAVQNAFETDETMEAVNEEGVDNVDFKPLYKGKANSKKLKAVSKGKKTNKKSKGSSNCSQYIEEELETNVKKE